MNFIRIFFISSFFHPYDNMMRDNKSYTFLVKVIKFACVREKYFYIIIGNFYKFKSLVNTVLKFMVCF